MDPISEPDLRDRYPEIERQYRLDGRKKSVKICMEPVMRNLDRIINLIEDITYWKKLDVINSYIFQSRAMGTCKLTSDIDIYIQLDKKHESFVYDNGIEYKNTGIKVLAGEFATKFFDDTLPKHLVTEMKDIHIDLFWGINEIPPAKDEYKGRNYYFKLKELKKS